MKALQDIYGNHAEMPYLAPQYYDELLAKPIAKRQMERTADGFLPGHIIMLWRIQFGSYRTDSPHHKYFYTTYGIDAQKELDWLMAEGHVVLENAREAIRHLSVLDLKNLLKVAGQTGLSKMKRADLETALLTQLSEQDLEELCAIRAYLLTDKGEATLAAHPDIVAKHPQKKF